MNEELFAELVESVREGGAILRGEKDPSRKFVIEAPDVKQIRVGSAIILMEPPSSRHQDDGATFISPSR